MYWITKHVGTMAVGEDLREDEYGCVIIDIRDLVDGKNDDQKLAEVIGRVVASAANFRVRTIVQCQAGISRSNAVVAAMLALTVKLYFDDAIDFVKKKCPRANINIDLYRQMKEAIEPSPIEKVGIPVGTEST